MGVIGEGEVFTPEREKGEEFFYPEKEEEYGRSGIPCRGKERGLSIWENLKLRGGGKS